MLEFEPKSEQELLNLLSEGEYDFHVQSAENWVSHSSGNKSIKLTLYLYTPDGRQFVNYTYLSQNYLLLVKHFCEATDLEQYYNSGKLTPELCIGKKGRCKVIIKQPKEGTTYQPQNAIKDFIPRAKMETDKPEVKSDFVDSDIPF
jgi:hypothetical protein